MEHSSPAPIDPSTQGLAAPQPDLPPESLYIHGVALWNAGRRQEAIALLDEAMRRNPEFPEALCMSAFVLGELGKVDAALQFYRRAIGFKVDMPVAWSNAGKILFDLERYAEALDAFNAALALAPDHADLWNSRAGALRKLSRMAESAESAREALRLRPDFAEAAVNLGNALMKLDRCEEAHEAYRLAVACKPDFAIALCGVALTLEALGRIGEAREAYQAAERLGNREAIGNRACLDLSLGDFERGWIGYEARWMSGKSLAEALGVRFPTWRGPGKAGERVLVMNDHGLGDTIQFARYIPMIAAAGAVPTFLCPAKMLRLLSSLPGDLRLVESVDPTEAFDAQIAISSLPGAFKTRLDSVPASAPYLGAEPKRAERWAARIGDSGFKVGVVWQGNPDPEADVARSVPLAAFAPLAATGGVRLIALQKGFGVEQLDALPPGMRVETLGEDFDAGPDAFVDTAAAMTHLDLIVTCDTSIAHLAGALGRPVWVALKKNAEWRWLRDRGDSPWYPTMRLFRQKTHGDWSGVFAQMAEALAETRAGKGGRLFAIPGAVGELLDKITILEIKARRIADADKLRNVSRELALLQHSLREAGLEGATLEAKKAELAAVNERLWDVEDEIRVCEKNGDFGDGFIALARAVYTTNDRRAAIKREINRMFNSAIVEEKAYA